MLKELRYTSSIKDMPLMFSDMKRTALLLCEGRSSEEIINLSVEKNIYQLDKIKRRRDVPLRMLKRLSTINKSLIKVIAYGSDEDAKLISFYALMKADRLLFEYMNEVYADKYLTGYNEIEDKDYRDFIERKVQSSDIVAKWSINNLKHICTKIKSALCEAGLAKRNGDNLTIQMPIIEDTLYKLFDESDSTYIKSMLLKT